MRERKRKNETEQKLAHDFEAKNTLNDEIQLTEPKTVITSAVAVAAPPPTIDLYSSYRTSENYEQKSSEGVSTQPFSPQESSFFSRGGETTTTTTTGSLKEDIPGSTAPKSSYMDKQDTMDDDIEELIEGNNDGSDNEKIKDDDFDF